CVFRYSLPAPMIRLSRGPSLFGEPDPTPHTGGFAMKALDLRGLSPAPVTPFTTDGAVDFAAIQRLGSWLGSINGVKSLVVLGHAGEGTFLTQDEQAQVIRAFVESTSGRIPVVAGITLEGTRVAA